MLTSLLDSTVLKLQLSLQRLESRIGLVGASIGTSVILLLLAGIYCAPAFELINHGGDYSLLAMDPFDIEAGNRFQNRILTPLIGYLIFLKGPAFIFLPLLIALAFISLLYYHFRKQNLNPAVSLGMCSLIVYSSPILYTIHFAGYVDTTSYLLLFLCYMFRRQPLWIFVFYSLALLNHEGNIFALPWIVLLSGYEVKSTFATYFKTAIAVLAALLPFFLVRHLFADSTTHLQFDFYLNKSNIADSIWLQRDILYSGIFQGFKLLWCLPVVATILALKKKEYATALLITCIIACSGLQLVIAADTSRLMGLAFLAVLIGALEIWKHVKDLQFQRLLWTLIVLNLIIPSYFIGYGVVIPFHSLPMALFLKYYAGIDIWETDWI